MRVTNETERAFYADEAVKSGWSVRQLERQINTMFYKRLLASRDKAGVRGEIQTTEPKPEYEMIIPNSAFNLHLLRRCRRLPDRLL